MFNCLRIIYFVKRCRININVFEIFLVKCIPSVLPRVFSGIFLVS